MSRSRKSETRACHWYPVCPMKRFHEQGLLDGRWIARYCLGDHRACVRYAMEQAGEPHPVNLLPDGSIDHRLPG